MLPSIRILGILLFLGIAYSPYLEAQQMDAGYGHTAWLCANGTVQCWGSGLHGQLGDSTILKGYVPLTISGLTDVRAIAAGAFHMLAIKKDSTVWAWGFNQDGELGDSTRSLYGTCQCKTTPVQVTGVNNVVAIAAHSYHSLALKSDGTVWRWGANTSYQQAGDTVPQYNLVPVKVEGIDNAVAIAEGEGFSMVLKNDGTVWSWGTNYAGQLGDSTFIFRAEPVQVRGLNGVMAIDAGNLHGIALKNDSSVWAWGGNNKYQLGNNSTANSNVPLQVSMPQKSVYAIAAGYEHNLALYNPKYGQIAAWGNNNELECGLPYPPYAKSPVNPNGLPYGLKKIAAGGMHSLATTGTTDTLWVWGSNLFKQLADSVSQYGAPAPISNLCSAPRDTNCLAQFEMHRDASVQYHWYALNRSKGTGPFTCTWTWGDGSNPVTYDTGSHVYYTKGTYYICLLVEDSVGCSSQYCDMEYIYKDGDMINVDVVRQLPVVTSLPDLIEPSVSVYPNPASTILYIASAAAANNLSLYSMDGKKIFEQAYASQIEISLIPAGAYFVEVKGTSFSARKRFVKL